MQFYEVRENFPDPAAQHLISLIFQGDIKGALAAAKDVPGGVNVTGTRGFTPLDAAVWRVNLPMVKALLKAGANPDGDARQVPLYTAVRAYDLSMARALLAAGANPDGPPGSDPPLREAVIINRRDSMDLLLQAGARVDAGNSVGETALMEAAIMARMDTVNYLLDHGASLWMAEPYGYTAPDDVAYACRTAVGIEAECARLIERIKAAHYPWPPPSPGDVYKLMQEGKWPPKEAQGQ